MKSERVAESQEERRPPYAGRGNQLILRDVLAIDRTRLANERTLLAWLRTALMLFVTGVTLIKLFEGVLALEVLGVALLPTSAVAAGYGLRRYLHTRALIGAAEQD
jgi:putative membrane protein